MHWQSHVFACLYGRRINDSHTNNERDASSPSHPFSRIFQSFQIKIQHRCRTHVIANFLSCVARIERKYFHLREHYVQ